MEGKPNFLPTNLHLPLFMLSRRGLNHNQLKNYFHLQSGRHVKNCRFENNLKNETLTLRKLRETLQIDADKSKIECDHHDYKIKPRTIYKHLSWQMPPNMYKVIGEPFKSRKGSQGAYWSKLPAVHKQKTSFPASATYSVAPLTSYTDKYNQACNRHKGVFVGNARKRRPTDRCMVNSLIGCCESSQHPGPGYYNLTDDHWVQTCKWHTGSEYIFYKASIVPVKRNSIHSVNLSFCPGPGRYETRFPRACPCPRNRIFYANLTRAIEQQKLAKALGLPHRKFNPMKYCSHDLANVVGHGHCRLFKLSKPLKQQKSKKERQPKSNTVASLKRTTALNVIKYMANLHSTKARVKSIPKSNFGKLNVSIRFSSVGKIKIRRPALRKKHRIAFGSGQTRFKCESRYTSMNALIKSQLSLIKTRRTVSALMKKAKASTVKSKLHEIPKYLKPTFKPDLRKRLFKFSPLPQPKILLTNEDICSKSFQRYFSFYAKPIDPKDYLKSGIVLSEDYKKMLDKYTKTKLWKKLAIN